MYSIIPLAKKDLRNAITEEVWERIICEDAGNM